MNEGYIKKNQFILGIILIVCFIGYWLLRCSGCGGSNTERIQAGVDKQLGKIEAQQQQIDNEIRGARDANQSAQESVQRAQREIEHSREAAGHISAGLVELQRKAAECRALAEANTELIESLGTADCH